MSDSDIADEKILDENKNDELEKEHDAMDGDEYSSKKTCK